MYKNKKILGLIPARGGSKRLPRKNVKPLLGKPLVAWTIEQALKSIYLDDVIVSTDDDETADISKFFGAEVPFKRPPELAADQSSSVDAAIHAIEFLKNRGKTYEYLLLLEPTSPLRKDGDIDRGIKMIIDQPEAEGLTSLGLVHLEHPMLMKKIRDRFIVPYANLKKIYQSQQADKAYFPYGVAYITTIESLYKNRTFYPKKTIPMLIERWQNYEVDDEIDFIVIESITEKFLINKKRSSE